MVNTESRFTSVSPEEFQKHYGVLPIARAIYGFTEPIDTHVVLTLLVHAQPKRILEIGTAAGHMTANLTEWSRDDATIYTVGAVADLGIKTSTNQNYEDPPRSEFGRFANYFGKVHKVCFITADSLRYDFRRLAPIDFAFVDGAHDLEHVLSDSQRVYDLLSPGGYILWHGFGSPTPWAKVREALERLAFREPILHVAETEVAYLQKATESQTSSRRADPLAIVWEGDQKALHSLAHVNRQMCLGLIRMGHEVCILPDESSELEADVEPLIISRFYHPLSQPADAHIWHRWPPKLDAPRSGHWVFMQPWEFGSLPKAWIEPLSRKVDEIWAPTKFVKDCYVQSGIPKDLVHVIPLGVDPIAFNPDRHPLALKNGKPVRFLFVGGTIHRKGIDVLLDAYTRTFGCLDDVCLVIKDMGGATFYRGQTAQQRIAHIQAQPGTPEIEYIDQSFTEEQLAGLYTACDCLVHPYRGEGFGLPIAEAMACGLPVIVTGAGAAVDFCSEQTAYLVAAEKSYFKEKRLYELATVDLPWLYEPNIEDLCRRLRHVVDHLAEAKDKGLRASKYIQENLTWDHTVAHAEARLDALREKPIRRLNPRAEGVAIAQQPGLRATVSLCMIVKNEEKNLPDCLESARDLFSEVIVVDTGSTDRTREIAKQFEAKVFEFPWIDNFAAARNESLRHATGEWIFWMDADDRLDADNREKLRALLADLPNENVAYDMKCLCLPDAETGTSVVVDHVRLFRNRPDIRWMYRIHEQILPAIRRSGGTVRWSDIVIHHVGYQDKAIRERKRERDLRLLMLENEENPNDPFTLFNLGSVYQEQGKHATALELLKQSLNSSHPTDSIVRKLFSLIATSHRQLGQWREALADCQAGRKIYPEDAELLFQEGIIHRELGDRAAAEACFLHLLNHKEANHFASVDTGIHGYKTWHNLGVVYYQDKKLAEAEVQWRAAVTEKPDFMPAWLGLGDIFLAQKRWTELEELVTRLDKYPHAWVDAEVLRARVLLAQRDFGLARNRLEKVITKAPKALAPRIFLSHVLLQEGKEFEAAEAALRSILDIDPNNAEAKRNLDVLLRQATPHVTQQRLANEKVQPLSPEVLASRERRITSQNGEDGVLDAIFAAIGVTNRFFVEFGCEDATECNAAHLLELGWRGLFMDGAGVSHDPRAKVRQEFITAENINTLFAKYDVPEIFDLLSIDIDGNDYWVWRAITNRPRVVVIEYNAHVQASERRAITYDPAFRWNGSDYYGASLLALKELGDQNGYTLIYCESTGTNAFFIANDCLPPTFTPAPIEFIYRRPNFLGQGIRHPPDRARTMIDPTPRTGT